MSSSLIPALIGGMLLLDSLTAARSDPAVSRQFPVGSITRSDQLPRSRLRERVEALPPAARVRALQWLSSFHFSECELPSLHADPHGGIFYVCESEIPPITEPEALPPEPIAFAPVPVDPFPPGLIFHSHPGAANVLYLNFTGETVTDTEWNNLMGRSQIQAVPFSSDTDLTTFSDAEQTAIKRIWQRVAEDYAPFNINVTTERPATFDSRTAVALITRRTAADGQANPYNTAGGVAYVNVFGTSYFARYRPAWIYHDNLSNIESYIAEAVSHEIGHNLGLSHDGTTAGAEYYGGHGTGDISWGPIMGTGYYRNVSQWCKGDYHAANNTQDDLAIIATKLVYRSDDHGNTPITATPLVLSGGTNLVSTTPESDPHNLHPSNKGILEHQTDVDVLWFMTGNGPVRIAVDPWIMPSGTRGGNLDLSVELTDEAGTLWGTDNPASQTTALIQTTLPEGRYYLHVRNSAAGDPFSASPTGYTAYGSLGQYFISGYVTEPTTTSVPPTAELHVSDLVAPGQTSHSFSVTFSDALAVAASTVDSQDIRVTGPNGYNRLARLLSLDLPHDGTPRTAYYAVDPPTDDVWSPAHNGTYLVSMEPEQVGNTRNVWVEAGELGRFQVATLVALYSANMDADPGWTLDPGWEYGTPAYGATGPSGGFTGSRILAFNLSGDYPNSLSPAYATTPPIPCGGSSTLTLRFQRWLRTRLNDSASIQVTTDGTTWIDIWSTTAAVSDSAWQAVELVLPISTVDSPWLQLRWGLDSNNRHTDIGWNLDDIALLSANVVDNSPPLASLSVAALTQGGAPGHSCEVTYTDDTAVRLATLDASNLEVISPSGTTLEIEFVGANLPADGSPITAIYLIMAPGQVWEAADNGTYTVSLLENLVEDTLGNPAPRVTLGSFTVAIPPPPGRLEVTPLEDPNSAGTLGGPFHPWSLTYTVSNIGDSTLSWTAGRTEAWASLSATSGILAAGASVSVIVSLNDYVYTLQPGDYHNTLSFHNASTGNGDTSRTLLLRVHAAVRFASCRLDEPGTITLVVQGTAGTPVVLQTSTDLVAWSTVVTGQVSPDGTVTFSELTGPDWPNQWYRVSTAP